MTKHERTIVSEPKSGLDAMSDEALMQLYTATFDAMDDLPMSASEIAEGHGLLAQIDAELAARTRLR